MFPLLSPGLQQGLYHRRVFVVLGGQMQDRPAITHGRHHLGSGCDECFDHGRTVIVPRSPVQRRDTVVIPRRHIRPAVRQAVTAAAVAVSKNSSVFQPLQSTAAGGSGGGDSATGGAAVGRAPDAAGRGEPEARRSSASASFRYPLAGAPRAACQRRIAARVRGPNRPSGVPGSKPAFRSPC